ncbi:ATP-binding protein [Streptomyces sp. NPDC005533]|uniref:ATP-binding protein n=1 Tax=Streptomyces sp. NPDC005533 TaxID=3364723 RepID=UPI0036B910BD
MIASPSLIAKANVAFRAFPGPPAPSSWPHTWPVEVVHCEGAGEHITWYLDFSFEAAAAARRAIRPYLRRWELDTDTVDTALLLVSELVANAVEHGKPPVFLRLAHSQDAVTIAVQDAGSGPSHRKPDPQDMCAESGRGLYLVEALCHRSCLTGTPDGTLAVAEIGT